MPREVPQWGEAQLATATAEQIVKAQHEGRLAKLLGATAAPIEASGELDPQAVTQLYAEGRFEDIERARREGRIRD